MRYFTLMLLSSFLINFQIIACDPQDHSNTLVVRSSKWLDMPSYENVKRLALFINQSHPNVKDKDYRMGIEVAQTNINFGNLYSCFEPFLKNSYPKKNADITKNLVELEHVMGKFVSHSHFFWTSLINGEALFLKEIPKYKLAYQDTLEDYAPEELTTQVYENIRAYFHIVQGLGNKFIDIMSHYYTYDLSKDFGSLPLKNYIKSPVMYLKDCNGYILFPKTDEDRYESVPILYGESKDGYSYRLLCENDKVVEQSGFLIRRTDSLFYPLEIVAYQGFNTPRPFCTSLNAVKLFIEVINHPELGEGNPHTKLVNILHQSVNLLEMKKHKESFIPIPETPKDYNLLQVLMLEDMIQASQTAAPEEQLMICAQIKALEAETGKPIKEFLKDQEEVIITEFEEKIQDEEQKKAEAEWFWNEQTPSAKKNGNWKKTTNGAKQTQAAKSPSKGNSRKRAEAESEAYKVEGRQKWRDVLKMVNVITKKYPALKNANVTVAGSHITLHQSGKESVTIAPKHSGSKQDLSLPAGTVNNFFTRLLNFALQTE